MKKENFQVVWSEWVTCSDNEENEWKKEIDGSMVKWYRLREDKTRQERLFK